MNFTVTAIILSFILYCVIAVGNLQSKDYPMAWVWFSYGSSQLGFLAYELCRKVTE